MNIELPVATNVRDNTDSLYQQCLKLIEKIYPLDRFQDILFPDNDFTKISDPVKIIWDMCRLGYPLCLLYNLLQPEKPLEVKQGDNVSKANASKRFVFLFIQACRTDLHIPEDELFKITDIFKDDTNLFVKVVDVLNTLVKTIEDRGFYPEYTEPLPFNIPNSDEIESPKDNCAKLLAELLNSERNYVKDLEKLHNYQEEAEKILTKEDSILLFSNLVNLLDFQRKFLIDMEKAIAVPTQEERIERIGQLFSNMEKGLKVYQVFCTNQDKAAKFANENCDILMPLVNIMEPKYELPSHLIKPVQRICKYPLLLNELIKYNNKAGHPCCDELQKGLDSVKKVTELTNEIKRQEENEQLSEELKHKIQDWKSVKVDELGLLLLRDTFTISSGNNEREYILYLFENMLLCCQEKKEKKKKGKIKITYILKGSIYISSVVRVSNKSVVSQSLFQLKIYWSDKSVNQCFILKSISEEQCNRWITQIEKLINIEKTKNLTLRRTNYHDYNNHYVSRVNQVDDIFTDEDYDNKIAHNTQSMYNEPTSRNTYSSIQSKNLNRSKSQPNIFNVNGSYSSKIQDIPPVPSYSSPSLGSSASPALHPTSINNFSSQTNSGRKNLNPLREAGSLSFSMDTLPPPQRTVSSQIKHSHTPSNSSRYYSKYDTYNDDNNSISDSSSTLVPSITSMSSNIPSLTSFESDNSMVDETMVITNNNNNNINNSNSNSISNFNNNNNRRTYQSRPSKINVENNKYNEDKGSLSPSNSFNEQYNEPVSPSSSYYNRNQYSHYKKPSLSKRNDNYSNDNSYRNDYINDYDYYDNNKRSEYNYDGSRRSEYNYDGRRSEYNYDGRRSEYNNEGRRNDYNEGRRSEYNNEGRRSEYNYDSRRSDYNYDSRRSEYNNDSRRSEYNKEGRRNDYNEGRRSEYNDNYGYDRERERDRPLRERNRLRERPLREKDEYDRYGRKYEDRSHTRNHSDMLKSKSSISSFSSYENYKNNSNISNNSNRNSDSNSNSNSNSNSDRNSNTSNNTINNNDSNNNYNNDDDNITSDNSNNENNVNDSPRTRPSPPTTPKSHPSTPNLSRPSLTNISRPITPNRSRPSTPNSPRPTTPNHSRPTTPNLSSRLNNMNVRRPAPLTDNIRSNYTKIRINYKDQEFIIPAPSTGCTYGELLSKIERKIRLNDRGMNETGPLRIRYKDEDDDYVTIITDEDIKLAFEVSNKIWRMKKSANNELLSSMVINLYVDRK